jgi:hypothetical protein
LVIGVKGFIHGAVGKEEIADQLKELRELFYLECLRRRVALTKNQGIKDVAFFQRYHEGTYLEISQHN